MKCEHGNDDDTCEVCLLIDMREAETHQPLTWAELEAELTELAKTNPEVAEAQAAYDLALRRILRKNQ
jgi:hypothetical protein